VGGSTTNPSARKCSGSEAAVGRQRRQLQCSVSVLVSKGLVRATLDTSRPRRVATGGAIYNTRAASCANLRRKTSCVVRLRPTTARCHHGRAKVGQAALGVNVIDARRITCLSIPRSGLSSTGERRLVLGVDRVAGARHDYVDSVSDGASRAVLRSSWCHSQTPAGTRQMAVRSRDVLVRAASLSVRPSERRSPQLSCLWGGILCDLCELRG